MRILVFGGAGRVAGYLLREATAAGHEVVAVARRPEKIAFQHALVKTVRGDLDDAASVDAAVAGAKPVDLVLMLAGVSPGNLGSAAPDTFLKWEKAVIEAVRKHGVPRVIFLAGNLATRSDAERLPLVPRAIRWLVTWSAAGSAFLQNARVGFDYLEKEAADVDWTVLRPGFIQDGLSKAKDVSELYTGPLADAGLGVPAADLCRWMLAYAAPGGPWRHQFPNVSYKG
jgi:nucleoside-diphosphate-sugar epimerase